MGIQQFSTLLITPMLLAFLASCSDEDPEEAADPSPGSAALALEPAPVLDLDTLQADTPAGVVEAKQWGETHVGAVSERLYVAIMVAESSDDSEAPEAIVYLCDGEGAAVLAGELDSGSAALTNRDLTVSLNVDGEDITGDVQIAGEDSQAFTAEKASGPAGLYGASFAYEEVDYLPLWIVLPDGSQLGQACWQCCSADGCFVCCGESATTGGVTVDPPRTTLWDRFWEWVRN